MSAHTFRAKVEAAFAAVIAASLPVPPPAAFNFYLSNNSLDPSDPSATFQLPCIQIECTPGLEEPLGFGNYHFECRIIVLSQSRKDGQSDPVALHNANVGAVFDTLKVTGLGSLLSAAVDDLYIFDPLTDLGPSLASAAGIFGDSLTLRGYGCPSDLTA